MPTSKGAILSFYTLRFFTGIIDANTGNLKPIMKQTTTEIFIEVEETIQIKRGRRGNPPPEAETNQVNDLTDSQDEDVTEIFSKIPTVW